LAVQREVHTASVVIVLKTLHEVHGTLESINLSNFDLEKIPTDPESDRHPSLYGHKFYAEAVFNVLREEFDELRQFDTDRE
jgi:hypothetical protein